MSSLTFGQLLKRYRKQTIDPLYPPRVLSQERFGELVQQSQITIFRWENDKRRIAIEDRHVLLAIIKVLYECKGISSREEANILLVAGGYAYLNDREVSIVLANLPPNSQEPTPPIPEVRPPVTLPTPTFISLLKSLFRIQDADDDESGLAATVMYWFELPAEYITAKELLRSIGFFVLWIAATYSWKILFQWPYLNATYAWKTLAVWSALCIVIPLILGIIIKADRQAFLEQKVKSKSNIVFHRIKACELGYMIGVYFVFVGALVLYYVGAWPLSLGFVAFFASIPLLLAFAGGRRIPYKIFNGYKASRGETNALNFDEGDTVILLAPIIPLILLDVLIYFAPDLLLNTIKGPILIGITTVLSLVISIREKESDLDFSTRIFYFLSMVIGVSSGFLCILTQGVFILLGTGLTAASIIIYHLLTYPGAGDPPLRPMLILTSILAAISFLTRYNLQAGLIILAVFIVVELIIYRRNLRALLSMLLLIAAMMVAGAFLRFQTFPANQIYIAYALFATALVVWQIWRNRRARRALLAAPPPPDDPSPAAPAA